MARVKVAVVQAGTVGTDAEATISKAESLISECAQQGIAVAVFPEAYIGGYPKGADFKACVGLRRDVTREEYLSYASRAIAVPGPTTTRLAEAARRASLYLIMGVIERSRGTLYCSVLFFSPDGTLLGKHRKTLPTAAEKLVWGSGDGSTLTAIDTPWGPLGAVICSENYLPLLRMAMYDKGLTIYCAPTAVEGEPWISTMRHVAVEGRCFVLSACQHLVRRDFPSDIGNSLEATDDEVLMPGGSLIVGPLGEILAGPKYDGEGVLTAEIDMDDVTRAHFDLDLNGHYSRPDIFKMTFDERPLASVERIR